jgi:16S rRNA (cytidine1402-2'-O)-methyltransferase
MSNEITNSALYLVPTPIGNLDDITLRAIKVLSSVDVIACEDTRHTGNLLKLLSINYKRLESYHEHNENTKNAQLLDLIESGKSVALVSDAGTPLISDPGYVIVKEAVKRGINVIALPGASAGITALSASGFATNDFIFLGFPPQKKGRKTFLEKLKSLSSTMILYESPYRIVKLIEELIEFLGAERRICIARELTKIHEEYIRGTTEECLKILDAKQAIKGEFVVIIESHNAKQD